MTAEVAILNKSAVALAADSAITISSGSNQEKIYDSADKLFELTRGNAIGVMINNDMNFMEAPLGVLIKRYRSNAPIFTKVREAADHFLAHLDDFARTSPGRIEDDANAAYAERLLQHINEAAQKAWSDQVFEPGTQNIKPELLELGDKIAERFEQISFEVHERELSQVEELVESLPSASFVGGEEAIQKPLDHFALSERQNACALKGGVTMLYERSLSSLLERDRKTKPPHSDKGEAAMKDAVSFTRERIAAAFKHEKIPARRKMG